MATIVSGSGSIGGGTAISGGTITVIGTGSMAFGYTVSGVIRASVNNAWQFGEGTNAIQNSMQIGANLSLRATGSIFMKEKASADADVAGWGQFWVKNDAPNVPMFTNGVGTDFQLATV